jgi:hypothetical protein
MVAAAWLTWLVVLSEAANAWWGATQMLPIAGSQAGAGGAQPWQEMVVKLAHIVPSVVFIVAWALLVVGFVKTADAKERGD